MSQAIIITPFDNAVEAIITGNLEQLQNLLQAHPTLATAHSVAKHQATLLHYVAANGIEDDKQKTPANIVEIAKLLLEAGANPNQVSHIYEGGEGSTPFVALISSSHPAQAGKMYDLIQLFSQYGDVNGIDNNQYPIATAICFRSTEALDALVENGATVDNIVSASAIGHLDVVKSLETKSLAPYTNSFNMTISDQGKLKALALASASLTGELDVVSHFVEQGVDIDAKVTMEETTALMEAVFGNQVNVVRYLIDKGTTLDIQDHQGFTALHWAAWSCHLEIVDVLLEHNAPLEILNGYGGTVIDTAIYGYLNTHYPPKNQLETLQRLIDAGADFKQISPFPTGNQEIDNFLTPYME